VKEAQMQMGNNSPLHWPPILHTHVSHKRKRVWQVRLTWRQMLKNLVVFNLTIDSGTWQYKIQI